MKTQLPGIVLALACCGASAAKADWEYTKWGMTPQQVVSASNNLAQAGTDLEPDGDGNVSKLVAPYQGGKFSFRADFGFDKSDKLASVTLVLDDKSAHMDMEAMLSGHMNMSAMNANPADMDQGICHALDMSVNTTFGEPPVHYGADHVYWIEKWKDPKSRNNVTYTVLYQVGCYVQYSAIK